MKIRELIRKLEVTEDLSREVWVYGTDGQPTKKIYLSWDDLGDVILYEDGE